ncbi:MAG: OmpA family protein [Actinomycetota bacterium]
MSDTDDDPEAAALLRELVLDPEAEPAPSTTDEGLSVWRRVGTSDQATTPTPSPASDVGVADEDDDGGSPRPMRTGILVGVLIGTTLSALAFAGFLVLDDDPDDGLGGAVTSSEEATVEDGDAAEDPPAETTPESSTTTAVVQTTSSNSPQTNPGVDPGTGEPFPASIGDLLYSEVVAGDYPHAVVQRDGTIVLRGRVPSEAIRQAGELATAAVVGADRVVNEYTIEPGIPIYLDSRLFLEDAVLFAFNSVDIAPEFTLILDLAAVALEVSQTATITVVAYADSVGPEDVNFQISRERATAVIDYWVDLGFDRSRFEIDARGETLASGSDDEEVAAFDRRVEFIFRDFVMAPSG